MIRQNATFDMTMMVTAWECLQSAVCGVRGILVECNNGEKELRSHNIDIPLPRVLNLAK